MSARPPEPEGQALDRVRAIERARSWAAVRTTLSTVLLAELSFAAFAVGHSLGPTPVRLVEVLFGVSGAGLLGLVLALPLARRARDRGARSRWDVGEGRGKRRVVVFDDYVLIDDEVVLAASVGRLERTEEGLLVRYVDPVAAGPLLRELTGPVRALDAVADALARAQPRAGAEPAPK